MDQKNDMDLAQMLNNEGVIENLVEMFGAHFERDIVESIAWNCNYDINKASNSLIELLGDEASTASGFNSNVQNPACASPPTVSFAAAFASKQGQNAPRSPKQTPKPAKTKKQHDFDRVIELGEQGYKMLILLRGLPGSGKSFLAKKIRDGITAVNQKGHIFSTDDYFVKRGVYQYNVNKISEAHAWNQSRVYQALIMGNSPIIVDNTNLEMWEMKPYAVAAAKAGYLIEILEPDTHWCFNINELARKNSHGVPKDKIKKMAQKYEKNITPLKLSMCYNFQLIQPSVKKDQQQEKQQVVEIYPQESVNKKRLTINMQAKQASCSNYADSGVDSSSPEEVPVDDLISFETNSSPQFYPPQNQEHQELMKSHESWLSKFNKRAKASEDDSFGSLLNNTHKASVLTPHQVFNSDNTFSLEKKETSSSAFNLKEGGELKFNLETWGFNYSPLLSWDIPEQTQNSSLNKDIKEKVETSDGCTQTERNDACNFNEKFKTIIAKQFKPLAELQREVPVRRRHKLMLDKSSMTEDIMDNSYDNKIEDKFEDLCEMFKDLNRDHLRDIYEKCNYDIEWVTELILDSNQVELPNVVVVNPQETQHQQEPVKEQEEMIQDSEEQIFENEQRQLLAKEESKEVKKVIESRFKINEASYSKHLLKIKKLRGHDVLNEDLNLPSTSTSALASSSSANEMENETCSSSSDDSSEDNELIQLNLGEQFVHEIETKFGDPNLAYPRGYQPVITVPLSFARQLHAYYIQSIFQQMETYQEVLVTMQKEDEEFAEQLQMLEYCEENHFDNQMELGACASSSSSTIKQQEPCLRTIISEEVKISKSRKENEKWRNETPDNLAYRLTKQKLVKNFPEIAEDTLIEFLQAHDNNYMETVSSILMSNPALGLNRSESVEEPPINVNTIEEMNKDHANYNCNLSNMNGDEEVKSAAEYREDANKILKLRQELHSKAQRYYQNNMPEVAAFYANLARQQTQKFNVANSYAAQMFITEQSKVINNCETLDLHFLKVKEAIISLDLFIDQAINYLQQCNKPKKQMLVITGRGKHNRNQVSVLRPAVIDRLKKRKITHTLMNPGMIKMEVCQNSKLTTNI